MYLKQLIMLLEGSMVRLAKAGSLRAPCSRQRLLFRSRTYWCCRKRSGKKIQSIHIKRITHIRMPPLQTGYSYNNIPFLQLHPAAVRRFVWMAGFVWQCCNGYNYIWLFFKHPIGFLLWVTTVKAAWGVDCLHPIHVRNISKTTAKDHHAERLSVWWLCFLLYAVIKKITKWKATPT